MKKVITTNAILWAAAIITHAMAGGSNYFSVILLSVLAIFSIASIKKGKL